MLKLTTMPMKLRAQMFAYALGPCDRRRVKFNIEKFPKGLYSRAASLATQGTLVGNR